MAHIWPPLPWNTPSRTTAQAPEERLWPGAPYIFRSSLSPIPWLRNEYKLTKWNHFSLAQSLATR